MLPYPPIRRGNERLVREACERLGVSDPRLDMGVNETSLRRNLRMTPAERLDALEAAQREIAKLVATDHGEHEGRE